MLYRFTSQTVDVTVSNLNAVELNFVLEAENIEAWSLTNDFDLAKNLEQANYMTYDDVDHLFSSLEQEHAGVATKLTYSAGNNSESELLCLQLTSQTDDLIDDQKIRIALVGGVTPGDVVGTEVLVRFVNHLIQGM